MAWASSCRKTMGRRANPRWDQSLSKARQGLGGLHHIIRGVAPHRLHPPNLATPRKTILIKYLNLNYESDSKAKERQKGHLRHFSAAVSSSALAATHSAGPSNKCCFFQKGALVFK